MAPPSAAPSAILDPHSQPYPTILQSSDLIASLPAPFLRLLVLFAKPITFFRTAMEVLSWRGGRRVQSWMIVGAWWGLCLGAGHAFMYLLPPLVFLPLFPLSTLRLKSNAKQPPRNTPSEPSTSETLLITLADLNAIYVLLPPSPLSTASTIYARFRQLGAVRLIRGLLVLWAVWICLGYIVGYRTLLAVLGSIILMLPSPPLAHLVNLLSKSLFFRRALALAFLFTFGSPPESSYKFSISHFSPIGWAKSKWATSRRPSLAFSFRPKMTKAALPGSALDDSEGAEASPGEGDEKVEHPVYFRFEVHENQRWWMGLDWTSALLPQERPSWCDLYLQPVSPPANFTLPQSTSVVVPTPTVNDPKAKVLRTAVWKWLDEDWSIVRAGPGLAANLSTTNFTAPIPSPTSPVAEGGQSGYSFNSQHAQPSASSTTKTTGNTQAQPSNRPTSFISPFGSSPPKTTALEETTLSPGARAQSIAEQAFTKGLERLKARTASVATASISTAAGMAGAGPSSPRKSSDTTRQRTSSQASDDLHPHLPSQSKSADNLGQTQGLGQVQVQVSIPTETVVERDEATDADGWVYGDNKWEGMGPKGGLGRFTRRRRWTRRAMLIETITKLKTIDETPTANPPTLPIMAGLGSSGFVSGDGSGGGDGGSGTKSPLKARPAPPVSASDLASKMSIGPTSLAGLGIGIDRDAGPNKGRQMSTASAEGLAVPGTSGELGTSTGVGAGAGTGTGTSTGASVRDDVLRMRLKKAMGSVGG